MNNKNQHWVPRSYLNAWIDPNTPKDYEGYVWVFSKSGDTKKNKSPINIFSECDFYTKKANDGTRDLSIERALSKGEGRFISVRRDILEPHNSPTPKDHAIIILFISIMLHRTKLRRDNERKKWEYVLASMNNMTECNHTDLLMSYFSDQDYSLIKNKLSAVKSQISYDDVKRCIIEWVPTFMASISKMTADFLAGMNMHIACAPEGSSFITSDHPCVLFDPFVEGNRKYTSLAQEFYALGSPGIEVTIPISPKQMVVLFKGNTKNSLEFAYTNVTAGMVDKFNKRTRFSCHEYFISNDKAKKDCWFN